MCISSHIFVQRPRVAGTFLMSYALVFDAMHWGLIYAGIQQGISASVTSLLTQTSVFMAMILRVFLFKESLPAQKWGAMGLIFVGSLVQKFAARVTQTFHQKWMARA